MADHYETMENELQLISERPSVKVRELNSEDKRKNLLNFTPRSGNFLDVN